MMIAGLSIEEASRRFAVCTFDGVIGRPDGMRGDPNHRSPGLSGGHVEWVNESLSDGLSVLETIEHFQPTVLLGLSAAGKIFDEKVITAMGKVNERPIIMPMSNPTSKCECTPEEAYRWTDGRAVVATGSPFPPVEVNGRTYTPSQCNNMYIFPGIGLASSVSGVTNITDKMFYLAAEACTNTMNEEERQEGRTFPSIMRIREVNRNIAIAVIEEAIRCGLTTKITKEDIVTGIPQLVERKMYFPIYSPLITKR
jgi:malate dehydrogenase (oxaloacetate-decarboxylating)(NADP+)